MIPPMVLGDLIFRSFLGVWEMTVRYVKKWPKVSEESRLGYPSGGRQGWLWGAEKVYILLILKILHGLSTL